MISKENQHTGSLDKIPEPAQLWSEGLGISVGQQASLHLLLLSTAGASPASASESPAGRRVMDSRARTHTHTHTHTHSRALSEYGKDSEAERLSVCRPAPGCPSAFSCTAHRCLTLQRDHHVSFNYRQPAPSGTAGGCVLLSPLTVTAVPPRAPSL